ncbi:hypothetical protein BOX15_Mlig026012g1, partial [Macrostomum lignano]
RKAEMSQQQQRVSLSRPDTSQPWGFRLHGGAEFQAPLTIESVAAGSVAERCGLRAGDLVLAINGAPAGAMQHEAAKMEIIRSGNSVEFFVQRGGADGAAGVATATWRPAVQQVAPPPQQQQHRSQAAMAAAAGATYNSVPRASGSPQPAGPSSPGYAAGGGGFNNSPRPFNIGRTVTTTPGGRTKQVFHNNYNSPSGLYASGFVQATFDSTLRAASQDADGGGHRLAASASSGASAASADGSAHQLVVADPATPRPNLAGASMYCGACGDMIKGVFVRVQGSVPMHPECLKCAKCGVGLRHCGYFYIEGKLYCETHAKQVAAPPEPGLKPVPVYK